MSTMKTLPNLPVHNGNEFTWFDGNGSAEISDFNGKEMMKRVWSDAMDVGFFIQSHRTKRSVLFTMSHQLTQNNEVVGWVFTSHDDRLERQVVVTIFND